MPETQFLEIWRSGRTRGRCKVLPLLQTHFTYLSVYKRSVYLDFSASFVSKNCFLRNRNLIVFSNSLVFCNSVSTWDMLQTYRNTILKKRPYIIHMIRASLCWTALSRIVQCANLYMQDKRKTYIGRYVSSCEGFYQGKCKNLIL